MSVHLFDFPSGTFDLAIPFLRMRLAERWTPGKSTEPIVMQHCSQEFKSKLRKLDAGKIMKLTDQLEDYEINLFPGSPTLCSLCP